MDIKVLDMTGRQVGTMELSDAVFGAEVNEHCVHATVVQYLANQRQGTKSTLTRAEVRGGGRKPWRQKGTGRARQGSIRAPHWTGGGVIFAPKPRDFSFKLNKKVKRVAMKSALSSRVLEDKLIILDDLKLNAVKTKEFQKVLKSLALNKALVVLDENDKNVVLSARNIENVKTALVNTINVYDILKYEYFVVTKKAVNLIQEVYA